MWHFLWQCAKRRIWPANSRAGGEAWGLGPAPTAYCLPHFKEKISSHGWASAGCLFISTNIHVIPYLSEFLSLIDATMSVGLTWEG